MKRDELTRAKMSASRYKHLYEAELNKSKQYQKLAKTIEAHADTRLKELRKSTEGVIMKSGEIISISKTINRQKNTYAFLALAGSLMSVVELIIILAVFNK